MSLYSWAGGGHTGSRAGAEGGWGSCCRAHLSSVGSSSAECQVAERRRTGGRGRSARPADHVSTCSWPRGPQDSRLFYCVFLFIKSSRRRQTTPKSGVVRVTWPVFGSTLLSQPNKVGLKCPSIYPYIHTYVGTSVLKKFLRFQWNLTCR